MREGSTLACSWERPPGVRGQRRVWVQPAGSRAQPGLVSPLLRRHENTVPSS